VNWVFQANEKYFNLLPALNELDRIWWIITRYKPDRYNVGDNVAIWKSGANSGIYALGVIDGFEVAGRTRPNPIKFWTKLATEFDWSFIGKRHATIRITKRFMNAPILRSDLLTNPCLKEMSIIRSPIGTNFIVTDDEWDEIQKIVAARPKERRASA
jgi:hypothetical protein